MSRAGRLRDALRSCGADDSGVSAVEFTLVLPVFLIIFFGGFQMSQGLAAYRKLTVTARTVADLTTQYQSMTASDVSTVLNASAQVMAPYSTTNLTIVLTQISRPLVGQPTVSWSKSLNGTPLTSGSTVTLPAGVCQPGASVVRAEVTYVYKPNVGYAIVGSFTMRDTLYMSPRRVQSVTYSDS